MGPSGNTGTGGYGGGIQAVGDAFVVEDWAFLGNWTTNLGAGMHVNCHSAVVRRCWILNNQGCCAAALVSTSASVTLVNHVIVGNQPDDPTFVAVWLTGGTATLLHNTIARSTDASGGAAVRLDAGVVATMRNTVLAANSIGVRVDVGASAIPAGTLFGSVVWANTTNRAGGGTISFGSGTLTGDPAFIAHDQLDSHIAATSAARDAGVHAGITDDIDGEARPAGAAPEIGANGLASGAPLAVLAIVSPLSGQAALPVSLQVHLRGP